MISHLDKVVRELLDKINGLEDRVKVLESLSDKSNLKAEAEWAEERNRIIEERRLERLK